MKRQKRTFDHTSEGRGKLPILFGLAGPSSGGKTYSALRLATGIERVQGGTIWYVDTESGRALHYRFEPNVNPNGFRFHHVPLTSPFSPYDYLDAIEHCVAQGAGTIIVDSMSHEHEGEGGVLEAHDAEKFRLACAWNKTDSPKAWQLEAANFPAWKAAKTPRTRLLNRIVQIKCNFILCFRAKEKAKPGEVETPDGRKKKGILDLGWMPIGGSEYLFEMTARALLPPNADGVPVWRAERPGEKLVFKLPKQFVGEVFNPGKPHQLCEADGEAMARWAMGSTGKAPEKRAAHFSTRLEWQGLGEWGGKPLAAAPPDALAAYGAALEMAIVSVKSKQKAAAMRTHLDEVRAATKGDA